MQQKVVIIGAGIGGLATALRLSIAGFRVEVYEQASNPGGKLNELLLDGFRFDTGPSLFTLPELVTELMELAGEGPQNVIPYTKLDNICKYHFPDGSVVNAWADPGRFAGEAAQVTGINPDEIISYLNRAKEMYNLSAGVFLFRPFMRLETFKSPEAQKVARNLLKLDMFLSMHKRNKRSFSDPRLVQLFDRYATYNGSNPYSAPATLNMISHLEHNIGAFFPERGMYSIVQSLYELAVKKGVRFFFNHRVEKVLMKSNRAAGVKVKGQDIDSGYVVSDVDASLFYKTLLPKRKVPWRVKAMQRSTSAIIFYWGINREFKGLNLHNIFFAEDYREEFDYLFKKKQLYPDPTIYVFISSKKVKSDAPAGMENWFVMVNAPENTGQYTNGSVRQIRSQIVKKLENHLKLPIGNCIVTEKCGTPVTIESATGSVAGSIYGNSSNSRFSAFLRHPNHRKKYKGLYFTGGSVHPGGGIPLCLASAKIVANDILNQ